MLISSIAPAIQVERWALNSTQRAAGLLRPKSVTIGANGTVQLRTQDILPQCFQSRKIFYCGPAWSKVARLSGQG